MAKSRATRHRAPAQGRRPGRRPLKRSIRRAQTVSPFGVGSIYDIGDESFAAMDTLHWGAFGDRCELPRLAEVLRVSSFRLAPTGSGPNGGSGVPYFRFPRWLFCPSCRQMHHWSSQNENGEVPRCVCPKRSRLAPMRFVAACRRGHMADVPWREWAHSKAETHAQKQCADARLSFEVTPGGGGGLGSLRVRCTTCQTNRSLEGIAQPHSLAAAGVKCFGKQPWQTTATVEACTERLQVLQRGASNLYYARVVSALDIPAADAEQEAAALESAIRTDGDYSALRIVTEANSEGVLSAGARALVARIAIRFSCADSLVLGLLDEDLNPSEGPETVHRTEQDLLAEEWQTLVGSGMPEAGPQQRFVSDSTDWHEWARRVSADLPIVGRLAPLVHSLTIVHRLREVRALVGFERIDPGTTVVRPSLATAPDWLPALEIFGEGIFLSLNRDAIEQWKTRHAGWMNSRLTALSHRRQNARLSFVPQEDATLLLVHTLAHLLIRQLSFECGYAASSLRERVFASDSPQESPKMAGILIYTADADAEGSMGGLARQGRPDRFLRTLAVALSRAAWCSADPICAELPAQGLGGLNRAACHSCALVSETSCQYSNVLLDRQFVVGDHGFFGDWVSADSTLNPSQA